MTGINFFAQEIVSKALALLHEFAPKAVRVAVLVNPGNATGTEATLKEAREAAPALGLQIATVNASTTDEIDAVFAAIAKQSEALLVAGDGLLFSRRRQLAMLAARDRLPMIAAAREFAEAGGLMSYGTAVADMFRQVGVYTGSIIKGAKPADLPVLQATKFEFVINLQTARTLGIEVPPMLLARADEVIE